MFKDKNLAENWTNFAENQREKKLGSAEPTEPAFCNSALHCLPLFFCRLRRSRRPAYNWTRDSVSQDQVLASHRSKVKH